MACCCTTCAGQGVTRTPTERGTTLTELCYACGGTGGWDEVEVEAGSSLAKAFMDSVKEAKP